MIVDAVSLVCLLLTMTVATEGARVDKRCPSNMTLQNGDGWSPCGFPNIVTNQPGCGRSRNLTWVYRVCDPNHMLTPKQALGLEDTIHDAELTSPFTCYNVKDDAVNYTFGFALLNSIKVPDLTSADVCINGCGTILPILSGRDPTEEEVDTALETLTTAVRAQWSLGICGNDVITVYSREYQRAMTVVGSKAAPYLTASKLKAINAGAVNYYFRSGKFSSGVSYLVAAYKQVLLGFSPAYVLLVITGGLVVFSVCLLYFVFSVGRDVSVLYDESLPTKAFKLLLYGISFLWLVKGWLLLLGWVLQLPKVRVVYIMAPMVLCLLCIFLAWLFSPPANSGQAS